MKMKINLWYGLILLSLLLTSCGSSGTDKPSDDGMMYAAAPEEAEYSRSQMNEISTADQSYDVVPEAEAAAGEAPVNATDAAAPAVNDLAARKMIRRANLAVETEEFDALLATVEEKIAALGGYTESFDVSNNANYFGSQSHRYAAMTVRIPEDNYDLFLNNVAEVSNVLSRHETVQDVTLQYVDIESHKKVLLTEQERLITLLEQADNIEDIIVIERRLSEVRYQIESMESQLRTYDNLIDYSTINLSINEVVQLTPVREQTTWEKISTGFAKSWSNLGLFFKNLFIFLVVSFPYLLVIAAFVVFILLIVRLCTGRSRRKKTPGGSGQPPQGGSGQPPQGGSGPKRPDNTN